MTVNTAPLKWAQRSDSLYVTIALPGECAIGSFPLHQVLIHRGRVRQPVRLVHELPIVAARVCVADDARAMRAI